jgi:ABC-type multidrug transport system permease subunit
MSKIHYEDPSNRERYPKYFETYTLKLESEVKHKIQNKETGEVAFRGRTVSYLTGIQTLLGRLATNVYRNPILLKAKFFQSLFVWLYVGGLFFDAGSLDYTASSNFNYLVGFMFFLTIAALMSVLTPISIEFPKEKVVLYKELDSKMYGISQYFLAKNAIELPELLLIPLITIPIYYFMADLTSDASSFFTHLLIFFGISLSGASLGQLIGSIVSDPKDVSALTSLAILPIFIFSGVFKNR